jgi:hypothetical protein
MTQTLHEFIEKLQKLEEKYNASNWTLQHEVLLFNEDDEYQYEQDYDDFSHFDIQVDTEHGYIIFPSSFRCEEEDDYDDSWEDDEENSDSDSE